jgi:hypothetical protein
MAALKTLSFVVGKTRSGKEIRCLMSCNAAEWMMVSRCGNFGLDDYFDAYCVFEFLMVRAQRRGGWDSSEVELFKAHSGVCQWFFGEEVLEELKELNGIITSLDVLRLGSELVSFEFKST